MATEYEHGPIMPSDPQEEIEICLACRLGNCRPHSRQCPHVAAVAARGIKSYLGQEITQ